MKYNSTPVLPSLQKGQQIRLVVEDKNVSLIEQRRQLNIRKSKMQYLCSFTQQYFSNISESINSDMVEIQRLQKFILKKNILTESIVSFIVGNFSHHKNQLRLLQKDTNDAAIISLSKSKYEIISMQVMDQFKKKPTQVKKSSQQTIKKQALNKY